MTTLNLHYGHFERPQSTVIRKVERQDPQAIIEAVHSAWWGAAEAASKRSAGFSTLAYFETLYGEAVALLQPHAESLPESLDKTIENLLDSPVGRLQSIFASALINVSPAKMVLADGPAEMLGYKLHPGKVLVLGENASSNCLGEYSQGIIINNGEAKRLGFEASGGLLINNGEVSMLARRAQNAISINNSPITYQGFAAQGGVHINISNIIMGLGEYASDGLFVNFKSAEMGKHATGGQFVSKGHSINSVDPSNAATFINAGLDLKPEANDYLIQMRREITAEANKLVRFKPEELRGYAERNGFRRIESLVRDFERKLEGYKSPE